MKTVVTLTLTWFAITITGFALPRSTTIILDAGHGGRDPGAVRSGVMEKAANLDVARRVRNLLASRGYHVRMTRKSDYFVSLKGRVRIANRYRKAIFVSIHFNAAHNRKARGVETYYCGRQGKRLAHLIQRQLVRRTRDKNRGIRYARYYVLRHCRHPAVLVEGGFLSNRYTLKRIRQRNYRQAVARSIAEGIRSF